MSILKVTYEMADQNLKIVETTIDLPVENADEIKRRYYSANDFKYIESQLNSICFAHAQLNHCAGYKGLACVEVA